ncbi:15522_t:CDS:2 [Dentiscutata erythropus]|uniref:15522_t:CDS:1 n=1 Tax=Dentiscutata erythropus TaxID=1348616 RepID=A0A9N9BZ82_9GLOM|nr:15522_t:CDS:2 [Dentiscutata erythropus]
MAKKSSSKRGRESKTLSTRNTPDSLKISSSKQIFATTSKKRKLEPTTTKNFKKLSSKGLLTLHTFIQNTQNQKSSLKSKKVYKNTIPQINKKLYIYDCIEDNDDDSFYREIDNNNLEERGNGCEERDNDYEEKEERGNDCETSDNDYEASDNDCECLEKMRHCQSAFAKDIRLALFKFFPEVPEIKTNAEAKIAEWKKNLHVSEAYDRL